MDIQNYSTDRTVAQQTVVNKAANLLFAALLQLIEQKPALQIHRICEFDPAIETDHARAG